MQISFETLNVLDSVLFGLCIYLYFLHLYSWATIPLVMYLIPQIIHTALSGRRFEKFPYLYFFCYIYVRMAIQMYERGCPDNYYMMQPNYKFCIVLFICVSLQLLFVILQHLFGSRFFIPKICRPQYYNYFSTYIVFTNNLPQDDDCCICMQHLFENPDKEQKKSFGAVERLLNDPINEQKPQEIQQPLLSEEIINDQKPQEIQQPLLFREVVTPSQGEQREKIKCEIMITPCKHKFHVSCLKSWMKIKLACPTCRADLPSLE